MATIPADKVDLFEKKTIAHLATLLPNNAPHVTPVWVGYDAEANRILINTERGRRKERNVRRNPAVGLSMVDPDNPYRFLSVTGEVDDLSEDGARDHIDELARRYTGSDYDNPIGTKRVIMRIRPDTVR